MTWTIGEKEFASVIDLRPAERFDYFVKRVADWEAVFSLRTPNGWVVAADRDGTELFPVWPHASFAEAAAQGVWEDASVAAIDLSDWIEKWLPGLEKDRRRIAVFPVPSGAGVVVEPALLRAALAVALDEFEV